MSITPGKLRGLTQPTIVLYMESGVPEAPGESEHVDTVFERGMFVFAQYIGNGRLILMPVAPGTWGPHVVMASALNGTSSIVDGPALAELLYPFTQLREA